MFGATFGIDSIAVIRRICICIQTNSTPFATDNILKSKQKMSMNDNFLVKRILRKLNGT